MSQQAVVVTRLADRHSHLSTAGREFADSREFAVPAGPLSEVLRAVAGVIDDTEAGRYTLIVSEPFS